MPFVVALKEVWAMLYIILYGDFAICVFFPIFAPNNNLKSIEIYASENTSSVCIGILYPDHTAFFRLHWHNARLVWLDGKGSVLASRVGS
jgi:hypothetical protein